MTNWRSEFKDAEQSYMVVKDQYSEIARALGFEGDAWFDDPLAGHDEIVARARRLAGIDALVAAEFKTPDKEPNAKPHSI